MLVRYIGTHSQTAQLWYGLSCVWGAPKVLGLLVWEQFSRMLLRCAGVRRCLTTLWQKTPTSGMTCFCIWLHWLVQCLLAWSIAQQRCLRRDLGDRLDMFLEACCCSGVMAGTIDYSILPDRTCLWKGDMLHCIRSKFEPPGCIHLLVFPLVRVIHFRCRFPSGVFSWIANQHALQLQHTLAAATNCAGLVSLSSTGKTSDAKAGNLADAAFTRFGISGQFSNWLEMFSETVDMLIWKRRLLATSFENCYFREFTA